MFDFKFSEVLKQTIILMLALMVCSPVVAKNDRELSGKIYYEKCISDNNDKRGKDLCESYFQGLLSGI